MSEQNETRDENDLIDRVALALFDVEWGKYGDWSSETERSRAYWRISAQEAIAVVRQWDAGK